eukprot:SAG31_NODE_248_length_19104_cov_3.721019_2_plen_359_part_00
MCRAAGGGGWPIGDHSDHGQVDRLHQSTARSKTGKNTDTPSAMAEDALKIIEKKQQLIVLRKQRNELQQQLHERLMRREQAAQVQRQGARLHSRKMAIEQQITLLTEMKEASRSECDRMKRENDKKRQGLAEASAYLRAARREQVESTLEPVTQALLWHYSVKTARVSSVRRALVGQLLQLFPIAQNPEGRYMIVSVPLDMDRVFSGSTTKADTPLEHISTGLGYVVHFLNRVCQYLHVLPPYEMRFRGSRSIIVGHDGTHYPLIAEDGNVKKEAFRSAYRLLTTNVCFLCALAGDKPPLEKQDLLLENLVRLARAEKLGFTGPLRVVRRGGIEQEALDLTGPATSPEDGQAPADEKQ